MGEIIHRKDEFEYVGKRFQNPDLVRFFHDFHKSIDYIHIKPKGFGRIKSPREGEFFSQEYLDFLSKVIGTESQLKEFLSWLRDEILGSEIKMERLYKKYFSKPRQIVEILFLLFSNQRELELNPDKPLVDDIINRKVYTVLEGIDAGLSVPGFDVFQRLEETIERGFFPISSQGELLIFSEKHDTTTSIFVSFPSGKTLLADKEGLVIKEILEDTGDIEEERTEVYFDDSPADSLSRKELVERITRLVRILKFHYGEGVILSREEISMYKNEFEDFVFDEYDCDIESIRKLDIFKRAHQEFGESIKQIINGLDIYLKNNKHIEDLRGKDVLVQGGAIQLGPREV